MSGPHSDTTTNIFYSPKVGDVLYTYCSRFAPLLQKTATAEDPSRVIVTASIAGLRVGTLGENATFGYSASKGPSLTPFYLSA